MTVARSVIRDGARVQLVGITACWGDAGTSSPQPSEWSTTKAVVRAALYNSGLDAPVASLNLTIDPAIDDTQPVELAVASAAYAAGCVAELGPRAKATMHERLSNAVFLGRLGNNGRLQHVPSVAAGVLAARQADLRWAVVPRESLAQTPFVPGVRVLGINDLTELAAWLRGEYAQIEELMPSTHLAPEPGIALTDVAGQPEGLDTLTFAAAGGHSAHLIGVPGAGATKLAYCLRALLPKLSISDAIQVTAIHTRSPVGRSGSATPNEPPFVALHHREPVTALIGNVGPTFRPGVLNLAHNGALFIHDASQFSKSQLSAVRDALETGTVAVPGHDPARYLPAEFQLLVASPPCACQQPGAQCTCTTHAKREFIKRVTDPLTDLMDLRVWLRPPTALHAAGEPHSYTIDDRQEDVTRARQRSIARWGYCNARVPDGVLREFPIARSAMKVLCDAVDRGILTRHALARTERIIWTVADLAGRDPIADDARTALTLRNRRPNIRQDS